MVAEGEPMSEVNVQRVDGTTVEVVRQRRTYRYLFDDGSMVDVLDDRDSSDARGAVLAFLGKERIEGVAVLPDQGALL